jgi:hypothetical protein
VPFSGDETVTVSVTGRPSKIRWMNPINPISFSFQTRPDRQAAQKLQYESLRKQMMREEFGVNNNFNEEELPNPPGNYTINVDSIPAPGDVFFHYYSLLGMPTISCRSYKVMENRFIRTTRSLKESTLH